MRGMLRKVVGGGSSPSPNPIMEVTPLGMGASFWERTLDQNGFLLGELFDSRKKLRNCREVRMPLETYEAIDASAISPDAAWVVYGCFELKLVSVASGQVTALLGLGLTHPNQSSPSLPGNAPEPRVQTVCFDAGSEVCAANRGSELVVFDVASQQCICTLRGADGPLLASALSRRRPQLTAAAATANGSVHVWCDLGMGGAAPPLRIDGAAFAAIAASAPKHSGCLSFCDGILLCGSERGVLEVWADASSSHEQQGTTAEGQPSRPRPLGGTEAGASAHVTMCASCMPPRSKPRGLDAVLMGGGRGFSQGGALVEGEAPVRTADLGQRNGAPDRAGGDDGATAAASHGLFVCCEGTSPGQHVCFRDASSGRELRRYQPSPTASDGNASGSLRSACVGVASGRVLLVLSGPSSLQLLDATSGVRLSDVRLGSDFKATGTKIVECAMAPDDSAIVALVSTRHRATSLVLLRLDEEHALTVPEIGI